MERNKVGKKDWKVLGGGKAVLNRMVLGGLMERLEQRLEEVEKTSLEEASSRQDRINSRSTKMLKY